MILKANGEVFRVITENLNYVIENAKGKEPLFKIDKNI